MSTAGRTTAVLATALAGLVATPLLRATKGVPAAIGARSGRIRPVAQRSPQYRRGAFHNRLPSSVLEATNPLTILRALAARGDAGRPTHDVPLAADLGPEVAADLAATWLGHASVLIELDGARVLADPVWSERVSPSRSVGPKRLHPAPVPLSDLPVVDAVIISHDHYDHLDSPTITELLRTQSAPFIVPLGIGAHLRGWGVPENRIIELDWDDQVQIAGLTVACTEARHFSGRGLTRNTTLWSSWSLVGPQHRVFFGGDTGYTSAFAGIGARFGPFDLTLLPIGAYGDLWPDIHMNPEEAVTAHGDLGGRLLLPIHWGTFDLAFHSWAEPVERLLVAAAAKGVAVTVPRPGGRVDGTERISVDHWWEAAVR